jgi:hypothetical protein
MIDALRQGADAGHTPDNDTEQAALRAVLGYGDVVDQPGAADPT